MPVGVYQRVTQHRKNISTSLKRYFKEHGMSAEWRRHISERSITPEWRSRMSESAKKKKLTLAHKSKIGKSREGKPRPIITRHRITEGLRAYWATVSVDERNLRGRKSLVSVKPNNMESYLLALLDATYPNEWAYVGDGNLIIAGKCPDFTNINGQKKVIELYGYYWHQNDDPQDRINIFSQYGYQTLVIWDYELAYSDSLMKKIQDFVNMR